MPVQTLSYPLAICLATLTCFATSSAAAENQSILIPAESKVVMQVDLPVFRSVPVGNQVFLMGVEGLQSSLNSDPESATADQMVGALGFDPTVELQRVSVVLSDLDTPENGMTVIVELRENAGNLAGVFMMLDDYQASSHRDYRIHSFVLDHDPISVAIHTDAHGKIRLIGAGASATVTHMLDHLDGATSGELSRRVSQATGNIADVALFEVPSDKITEAPFAGIAQVVRSINFQVTSNDSDLQVALTAKTASEQDSQQVAQMIQGLASVMVSMAGSDPNAPAEVQMMGEFLKSLEVEVQGNAAVFQIEVPQRLIEEQVGTLMSGV